MYRHLHEHGYQRFAMQCGILSGNNTGGAAQVAAAHFPNERTWIPHSAARRTHRQSPIEVLTWQC